MYTVRVHIDIGRVFLMIANEKYWTGPAPPSPPFEMLRYV